MKSFPLNRSHDRQGFDCGDDWVNRFLKESALQDQDRDLSRTIVFVEDQDAEKIVAYHTLFIAQVIQEEIPNDRPRIKRDIPVILLGQLGVDFGFQGSGIGDLLLFDIQARIAEISQFVGVRALALDARNEKLAGWYERMGFSRMPPALRMFKGITSISRLVEGP